MIYPHHKKWANFIFQIYLNKLYEKHFNQIYFLNDFRIIKNNLPVLLLGNHSTWWDGFWAYTINKKYFNRKFHILMLEEMLLKYPFFKKLGAYSIDLQNPKKIIESTNFTKNLLESNKNLVTFFPEGILKPNLGEKIIFKNGLDRIINNLKNPILIQFCAFKVIYYNKKLPDLYINFSNSEIINPNNVFTITEKSVIIDNLILEINDFSKKINTQ